MDRGAWGATVYVETKSWTQLSVYFLNFWPHCMACSILVPWPGNESSPQQWTCRVFTTGPPRTSLRLQTSNLKFLWVRIRGGVLQKPKLGGSHLEVSAGCSQCTGCGWGSLKTWLELEDLVPRLLIHVAVDRWPQILTAGAFLRYF